MIQQPLGGKSKWRAKYSKVVCRTTKQDQPVISLASRYSVEPVNLYKDTSWLVKERQKAAKKAYNEIRNGGEC
jgi:hypothetical protein